ncbi:MAG: J domain-containing protein [Smithella sp.]|jgi:hypothetical protein
MPAMQTTSSELFQACETIFGPDVKVSNDFLEYLQPIGIKTAFRKRAFETHPDRARAMGDFAGDLNAEFINVRQAYERLLSFVETKNGLNFNARPFNASTTTQNTFYQNTRPSKSGQNKNHHNPRHNLKKRKPHTDHFYAGSFPKGNLMLGQFLYYSGLISWRTLIDAICWQRSQRPLIGHIAIAWGLISYQDVLRILTVRTFDEKFGECARRVGYISNFEHFALIGKQRQLQRPFGEYFIESGIISPMDLISIAQKQQRHNMTSYKWNE